MEYLNIDQEKCVCCGACFMATDLIVENHIGKAESVCKSIEKSKLAELQSAIEVCPVQAIKIIEENLIHEKGIKGLVELGTLLKERLSAVEIPKITVEDVKFGSSNYPVSAPFPSGEHRYAYSSESKAQKAGLEEFNRLAYSQYRKFILDIFVQYKLDKIKPYYTLDETGFYAITNKKFEQILKDFSIEASNLSGEKIKFSDEYKKFSAYPGGQEDKSRKWAVMGLENFHENSTCSGIMQDFNNTSCHNKNDYLLYFDTDDTEEYAGESFFGNSQYKTMWCYYNVSEAVNEYIKDLKMSMDYVDIDEHAVNLINIVLDQYREEVQKTIKNKCDEFEKIMKCIL